jgi:mannose-6-phosphate isomerase-like protein (cupin superfamily)
MTVRLVRDAGVAEQVTFDESTGSPALVQTILRIGAGTTSARTAGGCDEILYVLSGTGALELDGAPHELSEASGVQLRPGEAYALQADEGAPLVLVSVRVTEPIPAEGPRTVVSRLGEQEAQAATADREFRIVADPQTGCGSVTQFVGSIPPGRAPDHYHTYDEVIYVIEGFGVLHIGDAHDPIGPGSCIHLSPKLVHSLENTSSTPMQVLGVFRPAGSPAEAYYPDGTLAVPG